MRRLFVIPAGVVALAAVTVAAGPPAKPLACDCLLPDETLKTPFQDEVPILFVARGQSKAEWESLPAFWNEAKQDAVHPVTGATVARRAIKVKVPLGLNTPPAVPPENPMTLAKWELGKKLYFDPVLSSNNTVSCASCHDPAKGWGDQSKASLGINNLLGPINAPTVINAAFNKFQFWDGRGESLEDQSQGPVGNSKEMFGGDGDPWDAAVKRLRANPAYATAFEKVFGHAPTRDAAAKAVATFERTVLSGNSVHDRADVLMRKRIAEDEGKPEVTAADYAAAVREAYEKADRHALTALGVNPATANGKMPEEVGAKLASGRALFFGKARCSLCHAGDTFTDHQFHNLGVGAVDGQLPEAEMGRYTRLPTGHKDPSQVGAFKTPGLRALLGTRPYLHDGSEKTLEAVVEFYDRGGNVNPFLDPKMRDAAAEAAVLRARADGRPADPAVRTYGPSNTPVIPLRLNLTAAEKADLVLFLKALEGDPVDPTVAGPVK